MSNEKIIKLREAYISFCCARLDISEKQLFIDNLKYAKENAGCLSGFYAHYATILLNIINHIEKTRVELSQIVDDQLELFLANSFLDVVVMGNSVYNDDFNSTVEHLDGLTPIDKTTLLQYKLNNKDIESLKRDSRDYISKYGNMTEILFGLFDEKKKLPAMVAFTKAMQTAINAQVDAYKKQHPSVSIAHNSNSFLAGSAPV